jgi:hypothetical protein
MKDLMAVVWFIIAALCLCAVLATCFLVTIPRYFILIFGAGAVFSFLTLAAISGDE